MPTLLPLGIVKMAEISFYSETEDAYLSKNVLFVLKTWYIFCLFEWICSNNATDDGPECEN